MLEVIEFARIVGDEMELEGHVVGNGKDAGSGGAFFELSSIF